MKPSDLLSRQRFWSLKLNALYSKPRDWTLRSGSWNNSSERYLVKVAYWLALLEQKLLAQLELGQVDLVLYMEMVAQVKLLLEDMR